MNTSYITTPIYYVNGSPHIGHAHTTIMADILKRYRRMRGLEVFMTTGTDEHGQKNQEAAEASGLTAMEYLDRQSAEFRSLFDRLGVDYDFFVRTTRPYHIEQVRHFERLLDEKGLIEKNAYQGLYCTGCEQFKVENDLTEDGSCPDHPSLELEDTDETNYFVRIEDYRPWLLAHLEANPDWLQPERYRNEVRQMLSEPLEDLCISRPKSRVSLGVELPFDGDYVTYVWFDALINYITNVGWPDEVEFKWWQNAEHLIGKDIVKTHCIYWPIMLHALEIKLPERVSVHGYWVGAGGQKMSKTLGNVVDPVEVIDAFGVDALRYYLAKNMRTNADSQISVDLIRQTYESDLANNLGNLLSRVVKFTSSRFDGKVSAPDQLHADDKALVDGIAAGLHQAFAEMDMHSIPASLTAIMEAASRMNEYVTAQAPWTLIKEDSQMARVESILYAVLDGLRLVSEALYPFMPVSANKALAVLGRPAMAEDAALHEFEGGLLEPGSALGEAVILFPRVE
ncbi:MAG: methionine--tRNA ligase [Alphaproteobacteria bacterium]|nr:methionine--tRNA ligase [Alphaproteobacteria bacterium]